MAKHSQAGKFSASNIFNGLKNFAELEGRITALPTEKERGDAFEVFAEAYLATQPICQAKEVWPQTSAPSQLLKQLGLPISKDMGTDGVVELKDGRVASYQAKFYTGRPSLNWSILSTFFAISDRVHHTIIFTNSDTLASTIEKRKNFIAIRGTDLDALSPEELDLIAAWLKGKLKPLAKFTPHPHQKKALKEITEALKTADRATAVMACGTGKTLLALWVTEQLKSKTVLVLVPSLALIQQTLNRWLKSHSWENISYLCVCSDPTVDKGADELVVRQPDLDFEVTTDSKEVRRFLTAKLPGTRIVFSTYQSARVIGQAMTGLPAFDLGIFDEAHKTAGSEGREFSFALTDKNLPVIKRLFLTATPRHYNVLKRDKEGDAKLVYSMDVPEVYGLVAHKLPFAEAVRSGIICNYKVIISVVTSDMVDKEFLRLGKVQVKGDEIHAQQVANQLALSAAVAKHGVGKIITFHRNIKTAQSFTADGPEGVANHLPGFKSFHVNGSMPSAERSKFMREFETTPKALISNARCLTEGVDVPAVDMVAFLSPRRSTVDIVQATGRAMRLSKGKQAGYILVPLFLEIKKGETTEDAVARGGFNQVWDILHALQEQDEVLADIIRQMRIERGQTKGYSDAAFREQIEILGPSISLEALGSSITTACIEKIGATWDERYGELLTFRTRFGHCNVLRGWGENPELAQWVATQRSCRKRLPKECVSRLTEIGFDWDPYGSAWENKYSSLEQYKTKHGHCNVPQSYREIPGLGSWLSIQRKRKGSRELPAEYCNRLSALGVVWDPLVSAWENFFIDLVKYKEKYGDCNVPVRWPENTSLGRWVRKQRLCGVRGKLTGDKEKRLSDLNFDWKPQNSAWEENFNALESYKTKYGNCDVQDCPKYRRLANWVHLQRSYRNKGRLKKDRESRLTRLGLCWDPRSEFWKKNFCALEAYKAKYGNCNVPCEWPEEPSLGMWVQNRRRDWASGKLSYEYEKRLTALGFEWHSPIGPQRRKL